MVWPLLLGLPEHAKRVAPRDCLLLLGIATTSFFAQLLMTRSFQLIPAVRAAAVSFTGGRLVRAVVAALLMRAEHIHMYMYIHIHLSLR
jgi:drug/metabolite transporter (DMT)-like permease